MTPQELLLKASQSVNFAMNLQAENLKSDSRYAMQQAKDFIEAVRKYISGEISDLEIWYLDYMENRK